MKKGILIIIATAFAAICLAGLSPNSIIRNDRFETDLAALSVSGNPTPLQGISSSYQISVFNNGSNAISDYQVRLFFVQDNAVIGTVNGDAINPGETLQVTISWTPQNYGSAVIYARIILAGDQNSSNDQSPNFNVIIQQAQIMPWIGSGTELARVPMDMFYKNSLFECLYYPAEFSNTAGMITSVSFINDFLSTITLQKPTLVWLGTSTMANLDAGWIPSTQLTQVFNGNIDYPDGQNLINIAFTTPFYYSGQQNLVMLIQRPMDTQFYSSNDKFLAQTDPIHRARRAFSDTVIYDPALPPDGTATGLFPRTLFAIQTISPVDVSGTVINSETGSGIWEASITLSGATTYHTTTNTEGQFIIQDVSGNNTYTYTIYHPGYESASGSITLSSANYDMGTLALVPIIYPPRQVQATVLENNNTVQLNWVAPEYGTNPGYRVWRLDDGQQNNQANWNLLTPSPITALNFTDSAWNALPYGFYLWAVKAIYTNGVLSEPAFSNIVQKPSFWGSVQGIVLNAQNQTIQGATISTGGYITTSGASGSYNLPLPIGVYSISVSAEEYISQTANNVTVYNSESTTLNFTLQDDTAIIDFQTPEASTCLLGNYPNPFNPETTISYYLKEPGFVSISIYNQKGQLVRSLLEQNQLSAIHSVVWDGFDLSGKEASSGIYYYRVRTGNSQYTRKMILLK